jgi:hypothetical protein
MFEVKIFSRSLAMMKPAASAPLRALAPALVLALLLGGCATVPPPSRVDYRTPLPPLSYPPGTNPNVQPQNQREWRAAGAGQDAAFERSALLADTFYRNVDLLLQQVEKTGAMGVNRGWEAGARKGSDWYIEEQRFADTVIGAGVNRNRVDLIDAGIRALEWGFQQQAPDGSFPCKENYLSASYFVAAAAHSIWLLESTGYARDFSGRIAAMKPTLHRAAQWLAAQRNVDGARAQHDQFVSRYFLTGYALSATGRVLSDPGLALAGEDMIRVGLSKQNAGGFFPERGGFDASFQAEALVYLLRYHDHAATADARRSNEAAIRRALSWLESRVQPTGVIQIAGNTRSGAGQERDRTGQNRRVSAVAVSRAFGLASYVLNDARYESLAKNVAGARQP